MGVFGGKKSGGNPQGKGAKKEGRDGWFRTGELDSEGRPIYKKRITAAQRQDFEQSADPMGDFPRENRPGESESLDGELRNYLDPEVFQSIGMESIPMGASGKNILYGGKDGHEIIGHTQGDKDGNIQVFNDEEPPELMYELTQNEWRRVTVMNFSDMVEHMSGEPFEHADSVQSVYIADDGVIHIDLGDGEEVAMIPRPKNVGYYDYYHVAPDGEATRMDDGKGEHLSNAGTVIDHVLDPSSKDGNNKVMNFAASLAASGYEAHRRWKKMKRRRGHGRSAQSGLNSSGFLANFFNKALMPFDAKRW